MLAMDLNYPDFTLTDYKYLLEHLQAQWRILRLCDAYATSVVEPSTLILRHDIDISPALALLVAEIESAMGVHATYFVALHLHYNPHFPQHAQALQRIAAMGHEIGLHYDSNLYPATSLAQNLALLDRHVQILQEICASPIVSIARHNPSLSTQSDPFQACEKYHNAYARSLFTDTVYISDSCGAWRTNGLRPCWQALQPTRIYLLLHAEQWAETTAVDRMARFDIMRARAMQEYEVLFNEIRAVWCHHAGGQEHDARVRLLRQES
jgi:hypothetical protein